MAYLLFSLRPSISRKSRILLLALVFAVLLIIAIVLGVVIPLVIKKSDQGSPTKTFSSILGNFSVAGLATDAAPCARVGKDILEKNGSAVDSAIATLLCMGVVVPHSMGLGGGFFMAIYNRSNGEVEVLDSRETAPSRANEDMFGGNPAESAMGIRSVAVPGEIHGYLEAHGKYGKLDWSELFAGAINISRDGFAVGNHLAQAIEAQRENLKNFDDLKTLLTHPITKQYYKEGEIFKNKALSETLAKLAKDKRVWDSEIAKDLANEIADAGGIVTYEDMFNYKPIWKEPTVINIGSKYTLYSVPLPGSGPILSFILNILQNYQFDVKSVSDASSTILTTHRIVEAFKFAYARRMELGDPQGGNAFDSLIGDLTSNEYARNISQRIMDNQTNYDPEYYGVKMFVDDDSGTAHLAVIAPNGDAVSATSTINAYFGSKVLSTKTGIILNNEMDDFSSPNITNIYGVPPSVPNYIKPGKRPLSSMCPSIVLDENGDVKLVVGGAGGTHITTGIALVILNTLFFGKNVKEAIDTPRIHHQLFPNHTTYEKEFPEYILNGLSDLGHVNAELKGRGAVIQAVLRGDDGRIYGNSDYRKGGSTDGF